MPKNEYLLLQALSEKEFMTLSQIEVLDIRINKGTIAERALNQDLALLQKLVRAHLVEETWSDHGHYVYRRRSAAELQSFMNDKY